MRRNLMLSVAGAVLVSGCSPYWSFPYTLDAGITPITAAEHRVFANVPAEGGPGQNSPKRIICAEPSPDVAQSISEALKAGVAVDLSKAMGNADPSKATTVAVDIAQAFSTQIVQLGERLATIQLLRDKMYRACEAYANGAVSSTGYTLMLARMDKTMTTLLSSEMAAGAFGRALAAAGSTAAAGGIDPEALSKQQKKVTDAAAVVKKTSEADPIKKEDVAATVAALNEEVGKLVALEFQAARAATGGSTTAGGAIAGTPKTTDVVGIAAIHRAYIDDDGLDPLIDACITGLLVPPKFTQDLKNKSAGLKTRITGTSDDAEKKKLIDEQKKIEEFIGMLESGSEVKFSDFCAQNILSGSGSYVQKRIDAKKALRMIDLDMEKVRFCTMALAAKDLSDAQKAAFTSSCSQIIGASGH